MFLHLLLPLDRNCLLQSPSYLRAYVQCLFLSPKQPSQQLQSNLYRVSSEKGVKLGMEGWLSLYWHPSPIPGTHVVVGES